MPTPKLFDFDQAVLAAYHADRIDEVLEQYPSVYVNHLRIARHLDAWAESMEDEDGPDYPQALREVAALLRQADFLPGGMRYEGGT